MHMFVQYSWNFSLVHCCCNYFYITIFFNTAFLFWYVLNHKSKEKDNLLQTASQTLAILEKCLTCWLKWTNLFLWETCQKSFNIDLWFYKLPIHRIAYQFQIHHGLNGVDSYQCCIMVSDCIFSFSIHLIKCEPIHIWSICSYN